MDGTTSSNQQPTPVALMVRLSRPRTRRPFHIPSTWRRCRYMVPRCLFVPPLDRTASLSRVRLGIALSQVYLGYGSLRNDHDTVGRGTTTRAAHVESQSPRATECGRSLARSVDAASANGSGFVARAISVSRLECSSVVFAHFD